MKPLSDEIREIMKNTFNVVSQEELDRIDSSLQQILDKVRGIVPEGIPVSYLYQKTIELKIEELKIMKFREGFNQAIQEIKERIK